MEIEFGSGALDESTMMKASIKTRFLDELET